MKDIKDTFEWIAHPDRPWNKRFIKDELTRIKHAQIISDPFKEHTNFEILQAETPKILQFFEMDFSVNFKPREISIWEAYKTGYDKAYAEINSAIGERELK